jgi:hypothetical protein
VGMRAQPFADGIPPDVAGDIFDGIGRAKNVVVVAHLPKRPAVRFSKFKGGALFEEADEFKQIAAGLGAFRKDMKVVRHEAKSVQAEGMAGRAFEQNMEDALGGGWYAEVWHAVVATDGDERRLTTDVVLRRETGDLAMDRHTRSQYTAREMKEKAPGRVQRKTESRVKTGVEEKSRRQEHGSEDPPLRSKLT